MCLMLLVVVSVLFSIVMYGFVVICGVLKDCIMCSGCCGLDIGG